MSVLAWDQVGDRRFETGIDRGVLYLSNGNAKVWNGLTSVTENLEREVKSYYIDGVKYLDHYVPGSYSAKLSAFTYPDELDELLGISTFAPGVFVHDQRASWFHLTYRTRVGNDLEGSDYGYKIHILYNVMASPNSIAMDSIGNTVSPKPFEWNLTGTPTNMFGIRPTSHISLDSRTIDEDLLEEIEMALYGTELTDPVLPSMIDLLGLIEGGGAPT